MTSRAGVGEAGGAGVGATPPVPGWTENFYGFFRILVLSEDVSRLDFLSSGLIRCGYSVTTITSCGLALEMMAQPNAFHIVFLDNSLKGISLQKMFAMMNEASKDICIIVFTPDYRHRDAKLCIDQGALLVVPYERIESFYSILWQFILLKNKFNSELRSVREQRKKIRWDAEAKADFECAVQFAGPDPSASSVAELMTVSGINSQAVANYMRKTRVRRAGALGAGPSVAQPSSFLGHLAEAGAGPSVAQPSSSLGHLAQAGAGPSVAQPSSFLGLLAHAGATDEGSRDLVLDTGDLMLSDLDFLPDFTQD